MSISTRGRFGPASGAEYLTGRLQPVHHRHPHVHQDDVGQHVPSLADRLGTIGSLADDQQSWLGSEYGGEAFAHHRLVVGNQASRDSLLAPGASCCSAER